MAEDDYRLRQAAVEAEYATDKHETTEQAARSHVLVRLARITIVIVIGIIMLPLPGPGALVIAAGLVILARDVAWADLALRYLRPARSPVSPRTARSPARRSSPAPCSRWPASP